MDVTYYESHSFDPAFNLALEQFLFETRPAGEACMMLWQNDNTIVVGKYQNAVSELDPAYVKEHGIKVVRRLSGGGAVYHDLGNLNFTFIEDDKNDGQLDFAIFCEPVVLALRSFGVTAEVNGRNDITIQGKKFSGNSQYIKGGRVMHHGTVLFDSDLSVLGSALRATGDKYLSKGNASVVSRVTNIKDHLSENVSLEQFKEALKNEMARNRDIHTLTLSAEDVDTIDAIKSRRYDMWDWNFGVSPEYSVSKKRRVENCGTIDIRMEVQAGEITAMSIHGDFFGNGEISDVEQRLTGCALQEAALLEALADFPLDSYCRGLSVHQFTEILCT
ncbi:MAG: lipoate--protein ligase [Clostridiales Family XIII bacterium]|jgi:lipoate-protein ligase A|nr:lipoate--protein ligase [Clostridiales Family XIII bacterium]